VFKLNIHFVAGRSKSSRPNCRTGLNNQDRFSSTALPLYIGW